MADVQNLIELSRGMTEPHQNVAVGQVNDHCLRLAVMVDRTYDWHHHPDSDELFVVLDGQLDIEFRDAPTATLKTGDFLTVPKGKVHRTIARGRTANLCFESTQAQTVYSGP